MKPSLIVVAREWDAEAWAESMRTLLPGRTILATNREGIFTGESEPLDAVSYALVWKPLQATLDRLVNLRTIFSLGAGVDHVFALPHVPEVPIVRIVDPDLTRRMTEFVAWQTLDHLRHGPGYRAQQRRHVWREPHIHPAASDLTVGIMGLGVLGASAAEALLQLGFVVRGWSQTPRTIPDVETFAGEEGLDPFLAGTDILVVLLPLTPETRGLIDLKLLRQLRRGGPLSGPVLINAGRGGLHVEADIVTALREGTLAGVSLDVFEQEPLPAESPLWDFENVTVTPHVAAVSRPEALASQIAQQIEAFERGEPLRNLVDRERGY